MNLIIQHEYYKDLQERAMKKEFRNGEADAMNATDASEKVFSEDDY